MREICNHMKDEHYWVWKIIYRNSRFSSVI